MRLQTLPLSIHVGLQTLRANPLRTVLSTLGVVMGAGSLVAVLSIGDGAESFARQQIEQRGLQTVMIRARTGDTIDGLTVPREGFPLFSEDDLNDLAAHVDPGVEVLLTVEGTGRFTQGAKARAAVVQGVAAAHPRGLGLAIWKGRAFSRNELGDGSTVAVVGYALAVAITDEKPTDSALGMELTLNGRPLRIVGILKSVLGERVFGIWVPLGIAEGIMVPAPAPRARTLYLNAGKVEDVLTVKAAAEAWVDTRNPAWRSGNQTTVASTGLDRLLALNQGILVFKILMGAFTAISLVVGGIGIMNVLLASVAERTKEIGVRKAAGARRRDILVQFLAESVVISMTGALLGAVAGLAGAYLVTWIMRRQTLAQVYAAVTWPSLAVAMGAAVLIGLIFGMYPALKAARLSPVEAMRYE